MFSNSVASLVRQDEPLAPHCWLKIGGSARYFAEAPNLEVLSQLCKDAHENKIPVRILGGGSNLLIRPGQVDALVIRLVDDFTSISTTGSTITAGGAASLGDVISKAAEAGLAGLEQLSGIPGTLGGAVVSNSGVTHDNIGSYVQSVTAVSREGKVVEFSGEALQFGYRSSNLEDVVITSTTLQLEALDSDEVTRRLQANWIVKKAAQPATGVRVAQAFIEPSGWQIAELLEAAGMKSASEGAASMNAQFPGFLSVNENASASEVLALTGKISRAVEVQSGIQLQPQLKIW